VSLPPSQAEALARLHWRRWPARGGWSGPGEGERALAGPLADPAWEGERASCGDSGTAQTVEPAVQTAARRLCRRSLAAQAGWGVVPARGAQLCPRQRCRSRPCVSPLPRHHHCWHQFSSFSFSSHQQHQHQHPSSFSSSWRRRCCQLPFAELKLRSAANRWTLGSPAGYYHQTKNGPTRSWSVVVLVPLVGWSPNSRVEKGTTAACAPAAVTNTANQPAGRRPCWPAFASSKKQGDLGRRSSGSAAGVGGGG